ncbi:MAG: molybdopterin-dependent oxidoreductase [Oligoflexia bacterium]|nr:molybdopterin-dependent oxidoreductase [Oligoflexia bacterium]
MNEPHTSARTHVTGESEFVDDRPATRGELFVELVLSAHAHARIKAIDPSKALRHPGVAAVFTAGDFHSNLWGTIFKDQPLLAEQVTAYHGEPVALVAAESREAARAGRSLVEIDYEPLPALLSIAAARTANSFIAPAREIARGDAKVAFLAAPRRLEGRIVIRGADHFYLENQASIAYPREDGQIEVHSSSQHPTETQHVVAHALGLSYKDVVCIVKRLGGGFGGKESQAAPFAAYAALVASKLGRPARVILSKDDDMVITGKRNPFENLYKVGFDHEGRLLSLEVELYSDGGAYADLSTSIMERAMLHCDNAYFIPNVRIRGQVCRTNFHPHTAFRGFGGPKGVATIERIIEEVAHAVGRDPLEIRKLNCYAPEGPRAVTPYGQTVRNNCLPKLLDRLARDSDYAARRARIRRHNEESLSGSDSRTLRGLSLVPVKFGISFTTRFLNQANALVLVHRDGSIQVSTGATEMGQGVNAKLARLVARELGLPRDHVRIMPTATDKNANTSPTAASSGADLNGAAAVLATRKIKARLSELAVSLLEIPESRWARHTAGLGTEPEIQVGPVAINEEDPNFGADWETGVASYHGMRFENGSVFAANSPKRHLSFAALVNEAYHHRISLSEHAHYRIPGLSFNKLTGQGDAFLYYTQGAALSEVSVNLDTGELKVLCARILMDLGRPVNSGIDLGQVTGAFIQGMGWVTTEKLHYNARGALLSHAPSTYKIPSIQDTPRDFQVELLPNNDSRASLNGMKAVGEPPLLLALSVWTAAHDALKSLEAYRRTYPRLELPATQEELLRGIFPEKFRHWEIRPGAGK